MENRSTPAPTSAMRLRQAGIVFSDAGQLAMCLERFGIMLVAEQEDERDTAALLAGIKAIASQIGYLSDLGAKLCGESTWNGADATKWLLPPVFHGQGEQQ